MSTVDQTVDITPQSGMDLRGASRAKGSPYVQNVLPRNGEFAVRGGFGTVRQYGTSLNAGRTFDADATAWGLGACIGATLVKTGWGAEQILAVHPLLAYTANFKNDDAGSDLAGRRGQYIAGVVAVVHDLHSGRQAEFVLHNQDSTDDNLMAAYPNYATRFDNDRSRWAIPQREPKWAIFAPCHTGFATLPQFNVVVAIDGLGLWTYRPVDSPLLTDRQNDSLDRVMLGPFVGEQGAFSPLSLADGPLTAAEGFAYLRDSDLGTVDALTVWNGNTVLYGSGNTVWFASPGAPHNVLADNGYVLPTPETITLLAPVRGGVFVATASQCWILQPSIQGNQDAAQLTLVDAARGCINNRAYCQTDAGVAFADSHGVYLYSGGLQVADLSKPVDRLWTDAQSLQLPLTDYYTKQGITALADTQLAARIDVRTQARNARLAWDHAIGTLFVVCDDVTLCWTTDFGWSVWLFQTHAGDSRQVRGMANIATPTLVAATDGLFCVCGPDTVTYGDEELDATVQDKSCSLLHMGRGGAIDRSTAATPAIAQVYASVLTGYLVPGDTVRLTIGAANYDWTMTAALPTFADAYTQLATLAVADPDYDVVADTDRVVCIAKVTGTPASAVSSSVIAPAVGTFTTTALRAGAGNDLTDADLEDERQPIGGYVKFEPAVAATEAFFVGKPVVVPAGYGAPGVVGAEATQTYWFPVSIGGNTLLPGQLTLHFTFDNSVWTPICVTAAGIDPDFGEMAFVLPSERLGSEGGYQRGLPDATHQVRVFLAGVPNPAGNEVRIDFDGTGGLWTAAPAINADVVGPNPILWLGFRYVGEAAGTTPVTEFWLEPSSLGTPQMGPVGAMVNADVYWWQSGRYPVEQEAWANLQQPVDWAVKSREAEIGNGAQVRCRGVLLLAMHLGDGTDDIVPNWRYGPLNTATSTDWRDYSGQALDFTSTPPGNSEQTDVGPFPRMVATNSTANPTTKTANNIARWGAVGSPGQGNLLIDDAAVDSLATTDGSQGVRVSVMAHGTLNAPGESVRLGRIEAVLRKMGNMQRWR